MLASKIPVLTIALSLLTIVSGWAKAAQAQEEIRTFTTTCHLTRSSNHSRLNDSECQVSNFYADSQWIRSIIRWNDGVETRIDVLTVNPGNRVDSTHGTATVDGYSADYLTFSDGGICFTLIDNNNRICYR